MKDIVLFSLYFLSSCSGLVLIKYGSKIKDGLILTIPLFNTTLSAISFVGFCCYIASFLLYVILVGRFELSFLYPFTVGVISIMIFISSAIFFGETITSLKVIGLFFILVGVYILNIVK